MNWKSNWGYKLAVLILAIALIVTLAVDFDKRVKEEDFKALEKAVKTLEESIAVLEVPPTNYLGGNPKDGYQFYIDGNARDGFRLLMVADPGKLDD